MRRTVAGRSPIALRAFGQPSRPVADSFQWTWNLSPSHSRVGLARAEPSAETVIEKPSAPAKSSAGSFAVATAPDG